MTTQTTKWNLSADCLFVGLEVGSGKWMAAFSDKDLTKVSKVELEPGNAEQLKAAIAKYKAKLGLPGSADTVSCYEAGREGFWVHWFLLSNGVKNLVVDSSSILVDRHERRAKTDGLDSGQLLEQVVRYAVSGGRARILRVVTVPTREQEDARRMHRERQRLVVERGAHQTRIKSLLALVGARVKDALKVEVADLKQWDGTALPPDLAREIEREQDRLELVDKQIREIEQARSTQLKAVEMAPQVLTTAQKDGAERARQLMMIFGIGQTTASIFAFELFWRDFSNRREVGCATGLVGTPYNSGKSVREQGISKAGNPLLRKVLVEEAWAWLRFQPQSEISRWFQRKWGEGGSRMRRIGIVALARRLAVELWRYLKFGVVPKGAKLRAA